jgi:hypothetical protein
MQSLLGTSLYPYGGFKVYRNPEGDPLSEMRIAASKGRRAA